jgi:hypothetical protein
MAATRRSASGTTSHSTWVMRSSVSLLDALGHRHQQRLRMDVLGQASGGGAHARAARRR